MKADRKKEVEESRKALKEMGAYAFFIEPMIDYVKEYPWKASGQFFGWMFLTYAIFTLLLAVNYDMLYCDSNLDQFDGKVLYVRNGFVNHVNDYNSKLMASGSNPFLEAPQRPINLDTGSIEDPLFTLECGYDFSSWRADWNLQTQLDEWRIVALKEKRT